jgi:hypothetical protein
MGKGGKTQCHHDSQHTNQATISKTCGEHRRAYLTRDVSRSILCSLDTTWQEEVACQEKISCAEPFS